MKFEETWSQVRLRQPVAGWLWDSMEAAHLLDNRKNITGLKFQVYVNFGVVGYDDDVKPFITSNSKDSNAFNRLPELIRNLHPAGQGLQWRR